MPTKTRSFEGRVVAALVCAAALLVVTAGALAASGFLRAWGSTGSAPGAFNGPDNITVDLRGDVYVADRDNNRVEKFDHTGRFLTAWGALGTGPGQFRQPRGVATDGLGDVYVGDSGNNRVQKFTPAGQFLARWGRDGGSGAAGRGPGEFNDPRGLTTDASGHLYVADHGNNRIQKLTTGGQFLVKLGRNGGDGSAGHGPGEFNQPRGVAVDHAGAIFVADKANNRIQKLGPAGQFLAAWGRNGGDGSPGNASGEFRIPYSVAVDPADHVFVADRGNNRVQEFADGGGFLLRLGHNGGDGSPGAGPGEFRGGPYGVASDCRGTLYVTDEGNDRIEVFGDPAAPPPACSPSLRLVQPTVGRGSSLALTASCDQICSVAFHITVMRRRRILARLDATRALPGGPTPTALDVRLPRVMRRALRRAPRRAILRVRGRATGFGGTSPATILRTRARP